MNVYKKVSTRVLISIGCHGLSTKLAPIDAILVLTEVILYLRLRSVKLNAERVFADHLRTNK